MRLRVHLSLSFDFVLQTFQREKGIGVNLTPSGLTCPILHQHDQLTQRKFQSISEP